MAKFLVLDAGNEIIKFKNTAGAEFSFPHALREIQPQEIDRIRRVNGDVLPSGYAVVNGKSYAYGDQAFRHGIVTHLRGAARYTPDYYGVIAAICASLAFKSSATFLLMASYAPKDIEQSGAISDSVTAGDWEVETENGCGTFRFDQVYTFLEPQGGLSNAILKQDGTEYSQPVINGKAALVIDVGGKTTDFLAVLPGGKVDFSINDSIDLGIIGVIDDLTKNIKASYRRELQSMEVDQALVREAVRTGYYDSGALPEPLDVQALVDSACHLLINQIYQAYATSAQHGQRFYAVILTGGGSALLEDRLRSALRHRNMILADSEQVHMANVRGGWKMVRLFVSKGLIEV